MKQVSAVIVGWRARTGTVLAALLLAAGLPSTALAKKSPHQRADQVPRYEERDAARPHAGKCSDRVIAAAEKRHHPARVRKCEESTIGGRLVYVLRMQKDGKVWNITVDAQTEREL
jgi:uncharacterized membrane protein YkoI